eukprot:scaffold1084_cov315-Pavlova_lutheri.AAC.4
MSVSLGRAAGAVSVHHQHVVRTRVPVLFGRCDDPSKVGGRERETGAPISPRVSLGLEREREGWGACSPYRDVGASDTLDAIDPSIGACRVQPRRRARPPAFPVVKAFCDRWGGGGTTDPGATRHPPHRKDSTLGSLVLPPSRERTVA